MSEVAKGFRRWRFFDLSDRDKRDMLKLMARLPSRLTAVAYSKAPAWPASRPFAATYGSGATVRRSTCRRGSTVRRRQPASLGSMPNVASRCGGSASPRTTGMPTGGVLLGWIAHGGLSGPGIHRSSAA